MNVKEIRRLNLLGLCEQYGRGIVAEKCGYDGVNYINQLLSANVSRTQVGDKVAAKIEAAFKKPQGWLDMPHPDIWPEGERENVPDYSNSDISNAYKAAPQSIQEAVRVLLSIKE